MFVKLKVLERTTPLLHHAFGMLVRRLALCVGMTRAFFHLAGLYVRLAN